MNRRQALEALGLAEGADEAAVTAAWRRLSKRVHPDLSPAHADGAAFARLAEAVRVLRGKAPAAGQSSRPAPRTVECDLSDVLAGRPIRVPAAPCGRCSGSGRTVVPGARCLSCAGSGQVRIRLGMVSSWKSCVDCSGTGESSGGPCPDCSGTGSLGGETLVRVPVHAWDGTEFEADGLRLRLHARPPPGLRLDGRDALFRLRPPFPLLVLGGAWESMAPWGEPLRLSIPPRTEAGSVLRVPGMGMPGADRTRGDARIWVAPAIPDPGADGVREWLSGWRQEWEGG